MTGKNATFFLRLGSTVTLWIVILAGILSGYEIFYFLLIAGIGLAGLWEYFGMLRSADIPCFRLTGMLSATIFLAGSFIYFREYGPNAGHDFELAVIVCFILVVFGRQMFNAIRDREPLEAIAYTLFGLIYIPFLFNFLTKIVYLPPREAATGFVTGQFYVIYLIAVTKFSDMGGYIFGMLFGRHHSVPHISPKKTWEGFVGALLTAMFASWLVVTLLPGKLPALRTFDIILLPILLGVAAIIGDLAESIIKRSTQTKDSSRVLPGIGGTLDLIDSVLFTAPILYFYMRLVLRLGMP
jgi:phosphatidate cytidylyltransferase